MSEFASRRENVFNKMKENSVAVIFSGVSKIASEDEMLPFVVNKNFFYLTGISQEHSALMLIKGISENYVYLFIDEYSELKEKWTGKTLTYDEVSLISDIKNVHSYNNLDAMIDLATSSENNKYGQISTFYLDLSNEIKIGDEYSTKMYGKDLENKFNHILIEDIYPIIRDLRMVKSPYEVDCILKAIDLTQSGINNLILNLKEGIHEYDLANGFDYFGLCHEKSKLAFNTIVAAHDNATCLHYPSQNDLIGKDDYVLIDLGYKYEGYSADISRTFPVGGVFEGKGRLIYEAVLNCNKAVINFIEAGKTIADLQNFTIDFLKNECIRLGLMDKDDDIKNYYYHNVSHHLGLDTHDVSVRERPLENGNVITVEPGLYFKKYNIGVRVEDDVLISNNKAEVLSKNIKKEILDLEKLFKSRGF